MCDVIKIRQKGRMREVGKKTQKRDGLRRIFMMSYMKLSVSSLGYKVTLQSKNYISLADGRTEKLNYRVASLLKKKEIFV